MAIRQIITAPDARLKQVSKPVEKVDDALRALMDEMLETMYAAPGIGLAAVQIGVPVRVIVMDLAGDGDAPEPLYFVNPEIISVDDSELRTYEEGCLSVPDYYEELERPARCRLRYLDYQGEIVEQECEGMLATCIQHEMDHLQGVLFIDHLSKLKRDRVLKRLLKERRQREKELA